MQFNGLSTFCVFNGKTVHGPEFFKVETNFKVTFLSTVIIGKKYALYSLYDGLAIAYFGDITPTDAALTVMLGTTVFKYPMSLGAIINQDLTLKVIYAREVIEVYLNGNKIASKPNTGIPIGVTDKYLCSIGAKETSTSPPDYYFYGYINNFLYNELWEETVTDDDGNTTVVPHTDPIIEVDLTKDVVIDPDRGIIIIPIRPDDNPILVHGISTPVHVAVAVDRDLVREPIKSGGDGYTFRFAIDRRKYYDYKDVYMAKYPIDRSIVVSKPEGFDISRTTFRPVRTRWDIMRAKVARKFIPMIQIFNGDVTPGQMDGMLVSNGPDTNEVSAHRTSPKKEFSKPVKLAVRCIPNYKLKKGGVLSFKGPSFDKWQFAPDNSGVPGSFLAGGESLVITDVIDDTNTIFWVRFNTDFNKLLLDHSTHIVIDGEVSYDG